MNAKKKSSGSLEKYLLKKIPIVREDATVKTVLDMMELDSNKYDYAGYIYVVDKAGILSGVFSVEDLFNNTKKTQITKIMKTNLITISPDTEAEKMADLALKHNLNAVPVVRSGKLMGVISSREVIAIVNKALREDIFHFAGIHKSHLEFESSLDIPMNKMIADRLSWLMIGLAGAILMAAFIDLFQATLAKYLIIASFVPAIVYLSDSLGTQIQTVFVRDLAVLGKHINLKTYFFRQVAVSSLIAIIIYLIMFIAISLFWKAPFIAFIISMAALFSLIATSITAFLITLLIKRFKFDPALGSGPIATIISDMTSVIIYFIIVTIFL